MESFVGLANEDFSGVALDASLDRNVVLNLIKSEGVNIILAPLRDTEESESVLDFVRAVGERFDRVRCIVMLQNPDAKVVTHAIRSGAKGILAPRCEVSELVQAVLTVRGGFEFFSRDVTDMLVNKYVDGAVAVSDAQSDKPESEIDLLSDRQIEILRLWGDNLSNKDIADRLFLSVRTVESHKNHIMQKLNLKTTVDIIRFGIRNNIIKL